VERHAAWAAAFTDESWFVLWPRQSSTWATRKRPQRIRTAKSWKKGQAPPSTCLYADLDATTREVTAEWHEPWQYLKGVMRRYAAHGMRFLIVFWDNAPWHLAQRLHQPLARYNRHAKRHGRLRVLLVALAHQGAVADGAGGHLRQTKRAIGPLERQSIPALQ